MRTTENSSFRRTRPTTAKSSRPCCHLAATTSTGPADDEGGLHGKAEVRTYWTGQWACTRTHDEPVSFDQLTDGLTAVYIGQAVRSLDGSIVSQGDVLHIHRVESICTSRTNIEGHLEP